MSLVAEIKRNQLAIISLLVALTALGYNTWRNELTEHNRNIRNAGFEMMVHIADLQQITYLNHYDADLDAGNPRKGWSEVLILKDLAQLMPPRVQQSTEQLALAWEQNWNRLGTAPEAVKAIDDGIDQLRDVIRSELAELD